MKANIQAQVSKGINKSKRSFDGADKIVEEINENKHGLCGSNHDMTNYKDHNMDYDEFYDKEEEKPAISLSIHQAVLQIVNLYIKDHQIMLDPIEARVNAKSFCSTVKERIQRLKYELNSTQEESQLALLSMLSGGHTVFSCSNGDKADVSRLAHMLWSQTPKKRKLFEFFMSLGCNSNTAALDEAILGNSTTENVKKMLNHDRVIENSSSLIGCEIALLHDLDYLALDNGKFSSDLLSKMTSILSLQPGLLLDVGNMWQASSILTSLATISNSRNIDKDSFFPYFRILSCYTFFLQTKPTTSDWIDRMTIPPPGSNVKEADQRNLTWNTVQNLRNASTKVTIPSQVKEVLCSVINVGKEHCEVCKSVLNSTQWLQTVVMALQVSAFSHQSPEIRNIDTFLLWYCVPHRHSLVINEIKERIISQNYSSTQFRKEFLTHIWLPDSILFEIIPDVEKELSISDISVMDIETESEPIIIIQESEKINRFAISNTKLKEVFRKALSQKQQIGDESLQLAFDDLDLPIIPSKYWLIPSGTKLKPYIDL